MDGIFAVKLVRRSFDSGLRPALRMTNFRCGLWNGHNRSLRGGGDDVLRQSQIAVFPEEEVTLDVQAVFLMEGRQDRFISGLQIFQLPGQASVFRV